MEEKNRIINSDAFKMTFMRISICYVCFLLSQNCYLTMVCPHILIHLQSNLLRLCATRVVVACTRWRYANRNFLSHSRTYADWFVRGVEEEEKGRDEVGGKGKEGVQNMYQTT